MMLRSLSHALQDHHAPVPIAWEAGQHHTGKDFLYAVNFLRNALDKRTENRWLLVHDNTYHFAVGLFALLAAGKQVLLPPNGQAGTLADLMQHADAVLSDIAIHPEKTDCTLPLLDLDAPCITLITSGSTGDPKAVRKTLRCLDAEIRALESLWGKVLGDASILATVSHQHIYGLLFRLLWPLCAGRPFAAHTHHYPEQLIADVLTHARAAVVSSPSQLKRFPPGLDLTAAGRHLAAVFSSGGPLPLTAAQDWLARTGQAPIEVLGSTETGGIAWRQQVAPDTHWQALPEVQVTTDAGQNLLVQSPFTGMDSAYATGDCIHVRADGHFQLLGRSDRLVKIEEKRLSLTSMEQHLMASPWVEDARVLVLPQQASGTTGAGRLGVVATLTTQGQALLHGQGKQVLTQQLRQHLGNHFERVLLPRKWRFPEQLPTDMQGKTSQAALVGLFSSTASIQVVAEDDTHRQLHITFPPDSRLFDGHFPGLPILPGVVQFDMAARQCVGWYPLDTFRRIDKLKFQEPVVPGDTITLSLQNMGNGQVQFSYALDDKPLSSGRIVFTTSSSDKPL